MVVAITVRDRTDVEILTLMKLNLISCFYRTYLLTLGLVLGTVVFPASVRAADEQTFDTPEQAVAALVTAVKNHDTNETHAIFGPTGHALVSPDVVQAASEYDLFVQRLTQKTELINQSASNVVLQIGTDGWPFPIPLVKQGDQWFFDTDAGRMEVLARRIGMNELGAISVCNAYVEAQREYAGQDRDSDGVLAYAQFLKSTPGKHDGLFWPTNNQPDQTLSPLGPLIAQARVDGYHHTATLLNDKLAPYHGYYFKILTREGKHAPAGKYDYIINGRMIAGFALVAWPAQWGNTGVMTFIVNQQGLIYQKNLGSKTVATAQKMTTYDPDDSWILVR